MASRIGEAIPTSLRVGSDGRLGLEFHGSQITSDAELLTYRAPHHAFGLTSEAGPILIGA